MAEPLWFRVKAGLPHSDGARILERRLGVERAWSYAYSLWDWFVEKHPEGELTGPDAAYLIARGAGWQGDPDPFCAAMVAAGYLGVVPEGFRVKGWKDWAGYHLTVRSAAASRQRRSRSGNGDVTVTSQGQAPEEGASEGGCHSDPSPISVSVSSVSKGGVGGARRRVGIGGGLPSEPSPGQPEQYPLTAAVLAALWDRKIDALWPAKDEGCARVERAIADVGLDIAIARLAAALPGSDKPWLGWHLDAIRAKAGKGPQPVGKDFTKTLGDL